MRISSMNNHCAISQSASPTFEVARFQRHWTAGQAHPAWTLPISTRLGYPAATTQRRQPSAELTSPPNRRRQFGLSPIVSLQKNAILSCSHFSEIRNRASPRHPTHAAALSVLCPTLSGTTRSFFENHRQCKTFSQNSNGVD